MGKKQACMLLHYDGSQWASYMAERTAQGTIRTSEPEVMEIGSDSAVYAGHNVYVVATERLTLLGEADFHRGRRRVVLASLFDNHSDVMEWARNGAAVVAVVVSFLTYSSVSSLSGAVQHALALIK